MSELNGQAQAPKMQLSGQQLAALLLIDSLLSQMQLAVNQLGGFMKYDEAANMIGHAGSVLNRDYVAMKDRWSRTVQLVGADALPLIESKH